MDEAENRNVEILADMNAAGELPDVTPPCACGSEDSFVTMRSREVEVSGRTFMADNDEVTECRACDAQRYSARQEAMARCCLDVLKELAAKMDLDDQVSTAVDSLLRSDEPKTGPLAGPHAAALHLSQMKAEQTRLDHLLPLREAKRIVAEKATAQTDPVRAFLEGYKPGENPVTRILVWDHRVVVTGHSANKAACVAISTAVQTAAAIGRSLSCVSRVERYETDSKEPVYDVVFQQGQRARRIIAGLLASFAGIACSAEGGIPGSAMVVTDQRKLRHAG